MLPVSPIRAQSAVAALAFLVGGFAWAETGEYRWVAVCLSGCFWLTAVVLFQDVHDFRRRLRARDGKCPECGYDVSRSRERCSECGTPVRPE